jgi:glycosyltransferase involved in cell wall biosynthesis/ubiquinone/menaquinone biosynthesis C-methylase UbiE
VSAQQRPVAAPSHKPEPSRETLPVRLSVLVPVYNEENSVWAALDRIVKAPADYFSKAGVEPELIVVDDGSTDGSYAVIQEFIRSHPETPIQVIRHLRNQGKGAAIRTALAHVRSDFSIIQDADLEYDPSEYSKLLRPLLADHADVVLGSRFLYTGERPAFAFWHALANRIISTLTGMAANLSLSDTETCYKAFRTSLAQSIPFTSKRFGLEPELIIKFVKRHARVYEVPITYRGRTAEDGKKIRLGDAFAAMGSILSASLSNNVYIEPADAMLRAMTGARRFNSWMADTLMPFVAGEVLEIGAGIGNLTALLCSGRERYIATDADEEHLMELRARLQNRPNLRVAFCDVLHPSELVPFSRRMDTVICLNVLEHIEDDIGGLRNIHSCLKNGGRAIILVPHNPAAFGTLDTVLGHYRRYTQEELNKKMASAGFRVERIIEFNRATYPGWLLNGRLLRRRTLSLVQLRIFDSLVPLWRRIDHVLPWPSTSIVGIGVRAH